MNELGIKPEHECFDIGHVGSLAPLIDMGVLNEPLHVDCIMGVVGGIPPSARNLAAMVDNIPEGSHWGVIGISREQWLLVAAALTLGGSVRVGLGGQPVPAEWRDGLLKRRADRAGAQDGRRGRSPAGDRRGGPGDAERDPGGRVGMNVGEETSVGVLARVRAAGVPTDARGRRPPCRRRTVGWPTMSAAAGGDQGARPLAPAARRVLLAAAGGLRRGRAEGRGYGHGRLHPPVARPISTGRDESAKSALFLALNRNKRSIRLDLKHERGREALLALVREHDVVLESFRPGVLERLGVGYERMREVNPGIVYCAISGYGQIGPKREASGHDMNYLGLVGLLGLTGERGGEPVQAAGQIADVGGGSLMACVRDPRRAAREGRRARARGSPG